VLSTQSDERLVDLVRAGSDPAFEAIVERYRRPLMRYVSRLLQPERAEDVVQQSFVGAYEAMRRDDAELSLRPWLYRIAHNNALNALRDRGLRHVELEERLDGVERPDQALERAQGLRALVVAVQALPERQRDAILLRELEGRSYEEIAAALGVTDGAVRQLLNRARNSLRAAAAAVVPAPLLTRVADPDAAEPAATRVAELVGVGATGAVAAKVCATALVTGVVIGGAAMAPRGENEPDGATRAADGDVALMARDSGDGAAGGSPLLQDAGGGAGGGGLLGGGGRRGREGGGDERSGRHGGGEDDQRGDGDAEDRSGRGGGDDAEDHSGRGGGDDVDDLLGGGDQTEDRSGPSGGDDGADDRSGSGGGDDPVDDDRSGSNSGPEPDEPELEEASDDSSGSGSGSDDLEPDSSGPGG
jgi:RNA polymerase sigma factor (sigma-70 family)